MDSDNLEFKEISEPEEKLDYDNLAACPHCKKTHTAGFNAVPVLRAGSIFP